jgi:toxin FitB
LILLDTNVLSALMRPAPDKPVVAWLDRQPAEAIWITSVTVMEIETGIALLPAGRRRDALQRAYDVILHEELQNRVSPFDHAAATFAAKLAADRRREGRQVDYRDTEIAGIALARRATLATRNVAHFRDLTIQIINPWESEDSRPLLT